MKGSEKMQDKLLTNISSLLGTYNNIPLDVASTKVTTTIVGGITAVKTADLDVWNSGFLTYTIVVTNNAEYDYEAAVFSDTLDTTLITLVDDTFTVDGEEYVYTYVGGLLSATLPTIGVGESVTIEFKVSLI